MLGCHYTHTLQFSIFQDLNQKAFKALESMKRIEKFPYDGRGCMSFMMVNYRAVYQLMIDYIKSSFIQQTPWEMESLLLHFLSFSFKFFLLYRYGHIQVRNSFHLSICSEELEVLCTSLQRATLFECFITRGGKYLF